MISLSGIMLAILNITSSDNARTVLGIFCFPYYSVMNYKKWASVQDRCPFKNSITVNCLLYKTLVEHCVCNLDETCDIGTHYEVARLAIFFSSIETLLVNTDHDIVESFVNFFAGP